MAIFLIVKAVVVVCFAVVITGLFVGLLTGPQR